MLPPSISIYYILQTPLQSWSCSCMQSTADMMERRARRSGPPAGGGSGERTRGAEGKMQTRAAQPQRHKAPGAAASPGRYFTAELAVLFLCLTALLVFLPLVLPPLPPPPFLLLLVPVGLMAVLLALAFVPSDGRSSIASSCL